MAYINRKSIFITLSVLHMAVIFIFSARNAEKSSMDSYRVGEVVAEIVVENYDELPQEEKISFVKSIDLYVRKSAHFLEYTLLGLLFMNAGLGFKKKLLPTAGMSLAAGSFYAVTDELHQYFVPGRQCAAFDWMIDTSGVLLGVSLVLIVHLIIGRLKK